MTHDELKAIRERAEDCNATQSDAADLLSEIDRLRKALEGARLGCDHPDCRAWDVVDDTPCECKASIDAHNNAIDRALRGE